MRNNALVMSPWRQSIWVSHEIGIIIPPALALVSNQLQGPRPGRGGGGVKSTAGTPSRQGEVLQLSLLVPGFLAPLVGLVVWGPLDAQELSCLVALHSFAWTRAIREGPQGVVNARGRITHTRFIQQLATTFSLSTHQCQPVCQCQGAGRGAAES